MIIPITLQDVEIAALQSEATNVETVEDVIHRLIHPLVERLVSTQLDALRQQYDSLSIADRVALIHDLQAIAAARQQV